LTKRSFDRKGHFIEKNFFIENLMVYFLQNKNNFDTGAPALWQRKTFKPFLLAASKKLFQPSAIHNSNWWRQRSSYNQISMPPGAMVSESIQNRL
jgi:hypothetical protein